MTADLRAALASIPSVDLGAFPTPLHRLPRLGAALGLQQLWAKREDASLLGGGGNKVRKLQRLLGAAPTGPETVVITFGAVQSNHARQTAAAAARLGMRCELILVRAVPADAPEAYEASGNVVLDRLFGATVHVVADDVHALERYEDLHHAHERAGRAVVGIPPGGSDALGTVGFVDAALELSDQGAAFDHLVVAASTGGTAGGLWLGLSVVAAPTLVHAVAVYEDAARTSASIHRTATGAAQLLGVDAPSGERLRVHGAWRGEGYGIPTPSGLAALELAASSEGLLLDPTYSGKAMAALVALVRDGAIGPDERVCFVATGGLPGLLAVGGAPVR